MVETRNQARDLAKSLKREGDAHFAGSVRDHRTIGALLANGADTILSLLEQVEAMETSRGALYEINHRQARCIHATAAALGPDTAATIDGLPKAARRVASEHNDTQSRLAALSDVFTMADQMLANGTDRIVLNDDFPHVSELLMPLNDPETGDNHVVASLDIEDSGYGPALWALALMLLRERKKSHAKAKVSPI